MSEDLTQYPDAIDDENRHRAPEVGQPGNDDRDLWETSPAHDPQRALEETSTPISLPPEGDSKNGK